LADFGIVGLGVHVPFLRLDRKAIAAAHNWAFKSLAGEAKGEKAFCNWDEDPITMAVEAVRDCVPPNQRGAISRLVLASTNLPFADLSNAGIVSAALDLDQDVAVLDAAGSVKAGISALAEALSARVPGSVVVASDAPLGKPASVQEMRYGSAAVALRLGQTDVVAAYIGSICRTVPFVDRFRIHHRTYDYHWEERWVRDEGYAGFAAQALHDLLSAHAIDAGAVKFLLADAVVAGAEAALAKAARLSATKLVTETRARCGHSGAAAPFLQLAVALEVAEPGDVIVMASFGYGFSAIAFRVTSQVSQVRVKAAAGAAFARGQTESAYLRYLTYIGAIELDFGMRAEADPKSSLTQSFRARKQLNAFVAGKCLRCATVQFPVLTACVECASTAPMTPHPLADEGAKMVTATADHLSYCLSPPLYLGLVQFDSGARVFMEVVDIPKSVELSVGTPVRMMFRRKEIDELRGYIRYFWKATPTLRH
jgi:3-hydroxy-3-methylglutaryl CoA synthase